MSPMLLEQFPQEYNEHIRCKVFDGLNAVPSVWQSYFNISEEVKAEIVTQAYSGFGPVGLWADGDPLPMDRAVAIYQATIRMAFFGMGFKVSRNHIRYGQLRIINGWANALARAAAQTYAIRHAAIFNTGFAVGNAHMAGQPLFSNTHVTSGGVRSNLGGAAALTPANLEALRLLGWNWVNYRGLRDPQYFNKLLVPPALNMIAEKISIGSIQPGTGAAPVQSDVNVHQGKFQNAVDPFFTSATAYGLQADGHGLQSIHGMFPEPIQYLEDATESLVHGIKFDFVPFAEWPDGMAGSVGA